MQINLDLQTPSGARAQALAAVIEARRRELGETAAQSCVAMAEGILRSLRAQTREASEKRGVKVKVKDVSGQYVAGWKKAGAKARRALRFGQGGAEVTSGRVVWLVGKYAKGESVGVFEASDLSVDQRPDRYLVVAPDKRAAEDYAKARHEKRVLEYKGLARAAIGLAMKAVYAKAAAPAAAGKVSETAGRLTQVQVNDTGFNSGVASVYVHDGLDYAALALKDGEASVQRAVDAALRKAAGYVAHRVKANGGSLDKSLKTTLDELIGAQK